MAQEAGNKSPLGDRFRHVILFLRPRMLSEIRTLLPGSSSSSSSSTVRGLFLLGFMGRQRSKCVVLERERERERERNRIWKNFKS